MRLDQVDLNLFVIFDAIYKERSITKVASLLNLTQPAISNALNRLRQSFDDQLFVRTPDGMQPTPLAEKVIPDVKKALQLLERSVGRDSGFDPWTSNKVFKLGFSDLASYLLNSLLIQKLQGLAPNVVLQTYYLDRATAVEDLKSGALDLLLDAPVFNAREFEQKKVAVLPYAVAMNQAHDLAKKKLTIDRYLNAEHIHVSSRRKGSGQMDQALHSMGNKRTVRMRTQSYISAAKATSETSLLWTAPLALLKEIQGSYQLKVKTLCFEVEPLRWNLYWRKKDSEDPSAKWIREMVYDVASRYS